MAVRYPLVLAAAVFLSGCAMTPAYERPVPPVPQAWRDAPVGETSAAELPWRQVFLDARLQTVITLALNENRDLRAATGAIERARAQYRLQRSALLPDVSASLSQSRAHPPADASFTGAAMDTDQYSASIGVSAYELDLFGRVRSLSQAALEDYLAVAENRRTVQISLIAETASAYLALAADQELLKVSRDALAGRDQALSLSRRRFDAGAVSKLDVRQFETLAEQARADVATAQAQVHQDLNALRLLVGTDIPAGLMPDGEVSQIAILAELPAGTPAEVLLRRPDVLAAEHGLKARGADIGAARAAYFPRVSLTAAAGLASGGLSNLFDGGRSWSFSPVISVPIFGAGAGANLDAAKAGRDIAIAQYERAIQSAFREVADALAVRASIRDRVQAQSRLTEAAADGQRLTQARYDQGVDSYLALLDAQRTLYGAQQTLVAARRLEAANRVELFRALGGGGG